MAGVGAAENAGTDATVSGVDDAWAGVDDAWAGVDKSLRSGCVAGVACCVMVFNAAVLADTEVSPFAAVSADGDTAGCSGAPVVATVDDAVAAVEVAVAG